MNRPRPCSTRSDTRVPDPTLFRVEDERSGGEVLQHRRREAADDAGDQGGPENAVQHCAISLPGLQWQGNARAWRVSCAALWAASMWEKPVRKTRPSPKKSVAAAMPRRPGELLSTEARRVGTEG